MKPFSVTPLGRFIEWRDGGEGGEGGEGEEIFLTPNS